MNVLTGWWRIWIVATLLAIGLATLVGLDKRQYDNELRDKEACFPRTIKTEIVSQPTMDNWSAYNKTPPEMLARGEIINPRVNVEQFSCVSWTSMLKSWGLALAAAVTVLAIIYVVRWIFAGFNRSQK